MAIMLSTASLMQVKFLLHTFIDYRECLTSDLCVQLMSEVNGILDWSVSVL